ncbi:hypothetical protein DV735_g4544, partial [Chaetothyriales sp. CBS 134920]
MADSVMADAPAIVPTPFSLRPRFKLSELPLVKEQRVAVDSLLLKFKKQGGYDALRKDVWKSFINSDAKTALTDQIYAVAEAEIDKNPSLLSRERGKAATLIQGALDRSDIYQDVESMIDTEISKHLDTVLGAVRDIRKADVGEARALEEEERGSKTDEQYRAETEARAEERSKNRARMEELARQTAELKRKIALTEEKKRREEQAKRDEEERKRREKEDEERRERRRKRQEEEDKREAERIKARDERARKREEEKKARRREYEQRDRDRDRDRGRDRDHRNPSRQASRRRESVATKDKELDDKDLEAAALEMLLNESKKMADKSRTRSELDRGDARRRRDRLPAESRRRSRSRGELTGMIGGTENERSEEIVVTETEIAEAEVRSGETAVDEMRAGDEMTAVDERIATATVTASETETERAVRSGRVRMLPTDEIETEGSEARVEMKREIGSERVEMKSEIGSELIELIDATVTVMVVTVTVTVTATGPERRTEIGMVRGEQVIDARGTERGTETGRESEIETLIVTSQDEAESRLAFTTLPSFY